MTIAVKDGAGASQTVQTLDDLSKGAGAVGATTLRAILASDDPAVVKLGLLEVLLTALAASSSVLDDWDESDRAKVNPIAGQAGVAGGAGNVSAATQRVTLAGDDPAVASLSTLDDWDESDRAKVNPIAGQAGVAAGAGNVNALTQRTTLAADDPAVSKLTSIAKAIEGDYQSVAASQSDILLGSTGALGDVLTGVLIVPANVNPGAVTIKDGNGSAITIFAGGTNSVSNLVPFFVPLGFVAKVATTAGWRITTGAGLSIAASGSFT